MARRDEWIREQREKAWAFGRELRNDLLNQYQKRYDLDDPPPPAKIIDELLTDFLGVKLRFLPLPTDRFAETRLRNDVLTVSINSSIDRIPGVGDAQGVENVAKWHECIHVVSDVDLLRQGPQSPLPGLEVAKELVCRRGLASSANSNEIAREFWAEEAGRAAAVSMPALRQSGPFLQLLTLAGRTSGPVPGGWPLLYEAAEDIGVNITALANQLKLEGLIVVTSESGKSAIYVQPTLLATDLA